MLDEQRQAIFGYALAGEVAKAVVRNDLAITDADIDGIAASFGYLLKEILHQHRGSDAEV